VAERTVSRLIPKRRTPPSQTWRAFLTNHVRDLVSLDYFTVPTAGLRVLFVLVMLARPPAPARRPLQRHGASHRGLGGPPIVDAFPNDTAPSSLLRDRDTIDGPPSGNA